MNYTHEILSQIDWQTNTTIAGILLAVCALYMVFENKVKR